MKAFVFVILSLAAANVAHAVALTVEIDPVVTSETNVSKNNSTNANVYEQPRMVVDGIYSEIYAGNQYQENTTASKIFCGQKGMAFVSQSTRKLSVLESVGFKGVAYVDFNEHSVKRAPVLDEMNVATAINCK